MLERLQKIIARAGIASRRHAEELIVSGQVTVNGVIVTELGAKADPEKDKIEAAGRVAEQPVGVNYYILNKPPNVVSTMADPEGRATLRHVLRGLSGGIFPVGRLNYGSSGLILLTSDGQLADTIFKVSSSLVQVCWAKVKGRPSPKTLSKVGHKAQARMRLLRAPGASAGHVENQWYEAELRGMRRDLLSQAFFAAGHPVEKLKRVKFGPLDLGDLPEGQYRQLAPSEVEALRRAVEAAAAQGSALVGAASPAPVGVRAFERKKWRAKSDSGPERPPAPQRGGTGERGGYRPDRNQFAPAAKGGPHRGAPGDKRSFQPSGGRKFPPREDRTGAGSFGRGAGKSFRPGDRGDRPSGGGTSDRRFGPRPGGDRFGPPSKGAPSYGGPSGGREFPPREGRVGAGSFNRGGDRGKSRGTGKFSPGPPRQGAAGSGKFRGKPGRPSGRPPGRPPGRPSGRPPHRSSDRPSTPPKDA